MDDYSVWLIEQLPNGREEWVACEEDGVFFTQQAAEIRMAETYAGMGYVLRVSRYTRTQ